TERLTAPGTLRSGNDRVSTDTLNRARRPAATGKPHESPALASRLRRHFCVTRRALPAALTLKLPEWYPPRRTPSPEKVCRRNRRILFRRSEWPGPYQAHGSSAAAVVRSGPATRQSFALS